MTDNFELPPDIKPKLEQATKQIRVLENAIRKAKIAGLDVSQIEQRLSDQRKQINGIKQGFYPNEVF